MDQQELERLVAQVKQALADRRQPASPAREEPDGAPPPPRLVTEAVVMAAAKSGEKTILIAPGAIVTPLAHDALRKFGIALASVLPGKPAPQAARQSPLSGVRPADGGRVALGVVPTARALEQVIAEELRRAGLVMLRVPSPVREAAHLARQVAGAVSGGQANWGMVVDETGLVGAAIANRVPGVLAATCHDPLSARWARERLGANVLCVAAEAVAPALVREIVATWIATPAKTPPDVASLVNELDRR